MLGDGLWRENDDDVADDGKVLNLIRLLEAAMIKPKITGVIPLHAFRRL